MAHVDRLMALIEALTERVEALEAQLDPPAPSPEPEREVVL